MTITGFEVQRRRGVLAPGCCELCIRQRRREVDFRFNRLIRLSPHHRPPRQHPPTAALECLRISWKIHVTMRRSNRKTKWLECCRRFVDLLIPQVDRKWLGQIYS